jgi:hypothetical protein
MYEQYESLLCHTSTLIIDMTIMTPMENQGDGLGQAHKSGRLTCCLL